MCQGLPRRSSVPRPLPHADLCARLIFELDLMAAAELSQAPTPRSEVRSESNARSEPEPEEDEEGEARSEGDRRPTAEERRAARDALLTLYARGLPPLLAAVEAAGKTAPPFYWTPKADFCLACAGFAEDFILPSLQALPTQAAVSVRLLQLLAEASLTDRKVEAGAAHNRQESGLTILRGTRWRGAIGMLIHGVRPPPRTQRHQEGGACRRRIEPRTRAQRGRLKGASMERGGGCGESLRAQRRGRHSRVPLPSGRQPCCRPEPEEVSCSRNLAGYRRSSCAQPGCCGRADGEWTGAARLADARRRQPHRGGGNECPLDVPGETENCC